MHAIIKYADVHIHATAFPWALPYEHGASATIANYDPSLCDIGYIQPGQRNPKNEERNYEYYVDIVSRPYRSFEIPFCRMQFGVFVGSFPFRYPPMMDYPITSGFFLFFFFFSFFLTGPSKLTQYHVA